MSLWFSSLFLLLALLPLLPWTRHVFCALSLLAPFFSVACGPEPPSSETTEDGRPGACRSPTERYKAGMWVGNTNDTLKELLKFTLEGSPVFTAQNTTAHNTEENVPCFFNFERAPGIWLYHSHPQRGCAFPGTWPLGVLAGAPFWPVFLLLLASPQGVLATRCFGYAFFYSVYFCSPPGGFAASPSFSY